jgi:hypothetical protein
MAARTILVPLATLLGAIIVFGRHIRHQRPEPPSTSDDGGVDGSAEAGPPPLCANTAPDIGGQACTRPLIAQSVVPSRSTCWLDVGYTPGDPATLTYGCAGATATAGATVHVGTRDFKGTVKNGYVDVCLGSTFLYADGCTWETAQRIYGPLNGTILAYAYTERVVSGTNCALACTGRGTFSL